MALQHSDGTLDAGSLDAIQTRIQQGAFRDAVALCAREHGAALGRLCMALLGDQALAEEVSQETLIAAHDAMKAYRAEGSIRAWLFGIARRKCARKIETMVRRRGKLHLIPGGEDGSLPDDVYERRMRATKVRSALEGLKPSERDVVLLRYEGGLSYREIAFAVGIDEAAARKRTSRALGRLRTQLQDMRTSDGAL